MITQSTLISYHTEAFVKTEVACTVVGCQINPKMEKFHLWIKVSFMEKMMDDFFICRYHPWMKSMDEYETWT